MLQQINPHVRTKFINSIHKNHVKYPIELQFKCDFFFPLKINRNHKTLLFLSELCLRMQENAGELGRVIRGALSPAQNMITAGAMHCFPAWGQVSVSIWGHTGTHGDRGDGWSLRGIHGGCGDMRDCVVPKLGFFTWGARANQSTQC